MRHGADELALGFVGRFGLARGLLGLLHGLGELLRALLHLTTTEPAMTDACLERPITITKIKIDKAARKAERACGHWLCGHLLLERLAVHGQLSVQTCVVDTDGRLR